MKKLFLLKKLIYILYILLKFYILFKSLDDVDEYSFKIQYFT